MGFLEQGFLLNQSLFPLLRLTFIDDILIIWNPGIDNLIQLLNNLNSLYSVSFTLNISDKATNFLNISILINDTRSLKASIYTKLTNTQQYLHLEICNPYHVKIPFHIHGPSVAKEYVVILKT